LAQSSNSLTFFDPPYYVKGPDLYTNFYNHNDHVTLSQTIHEIMPNKHWILTYDLAPQIIDLYNDYHHIQYYLNYSISKPTSGIEYMFFSNVIDAGELNNYLNLVI